MVIECAWQHARNIKEPLTSQSKTASFVYLLRTKRASLGHAKTESGYKTSPPGCFWVSAGGCRGLSLTSLFCWDSRNKSGVRTAPDTASAKSSDRCYTDVSLRACWPGVFSGNRACCLPAKTAEKDPGRPLFLRTSSLQWARGSDQLGLVSKHLQNILNSHDPTHIPSQSESQHTRARTRTRTRTHLYTSFVVYDIHISMLLQTNLNIYSPPPLHTPSLPK